jgi:exosortase E/protease (VPEID-CTERM system)
MSGSSAASFVSRTYCCSCRRRLSPCGFQLALNGFHSQAGWIAFVAVTGGFMTLAHNSAFFRRDAPAPAEDKGVRLAAALLAPFAALMAARILAALGGGALWLSVAALALPLAALWLNRAALRPLFGPLRLEPIAIGLLVGAAWIATEPASGTNELGAWLGAQPPWAATLWLALRVVGFALIVPLAEELAFRGYLHRALVARRFETAAPAAFGWGAFLVTSVLFGLMHDRWLAGMLAGAAFAIALYRSGSLTGPVAAHAAANGLIAGYAIAMQDWALL